jgi:hypothetical protein
MGKSAKQAAADAISPSDYMHNVKAQDLDAYFESIKVARQKWEKWCDNEGDEWKPTLPEAKKLLAAYKLLFLFSDALGPKWILTTIVSRQEIEELDGFISAQKRNKALKKAATPKTIQGKGGLSGFKVMQAMSLSHTE